MIDNCPVDRQSIKDALHIFGPSTTNLQGKSTRSPQDHVILERMTHIPTIILSRHTYILLGMNISLIGYDSSSHILAMLNSALLQNYLM